MPFTALVMFTPQAKGVLLGTITTGRHQGNLLAEWAEVRPRPHK